ncbi:hypothetical protein C7B82_28450 [Stenomitos frigidus ULC18]|uniref:Uncharacterized protein n=1 Tax=Stenomitos frigidus ULC18 TaxID=2107698 RepID=A0A2T1DU86_9CYAN|nr:hypothetical protein C7B82_28450 [Stenomitos frigidus ULC18]
MSPICFTGEKKQTLQNQASLESSATGAMTRKAVQPFLMLSLKKPFNVILAVSFFCQTRREESSPLRKFVHDKPHWITAKYL